MVLSPAFYVIITGICCTLLVSVYLIEYIQLSLDNGLLRIVADSKPKTVSNPIWPSGKEISNRIVNQIMHIDRLNAKSDLPGKLILIVPHKNYPPLPPDGVNIFRRQGCSRLRCTLTRSNSTWKSADAVLFQKFTAEEVKTFLPKPANQIWIASGGESPLLNDAMGILETRLMKNLVNWTSFYRRDSTVPDPWGTFVPLPQYTGRLEDYLPPTNYARGKTNTVAWAVSNCWMAPSGRLAYAKELSKYIRVVTYGRCGSRARRMPTCHSKTSQSANSCLAMIGRMFKFYLAFENSNCKDYITEKFHRNALRYNIIPIVLGASRDDYEAVAPPGSFIHVDDFSSPRELAAYLSVLDANDTLYNEYFRWKSTGQYIDDKYWCRLCAMLHARVEQNYVHWYEDFYSWWSAGVCLPRDTDTHVKSKLPWQSWNKNQSYPAYEHKANESDYAPKIDKIIRDFVGQSRNRSTYFRPLRKRTPVKRYTKRKYRTPLYVFEH